jgi:hypothetical protein
MFILQPLTKKEKKKIIFFGTRRVGKEESVAHFPLSLLPASSH